MDQVKLGIRSTKKEEENFPITGFSVEVYNVESGKTLPDIATLDIRLRPSEIVTAQIEFYTSKELKVTEIYELNLEENIDLVGITATSGHSGKRYKLMEIEDA